MAAKKDSGIKKQKYSGKGSKIKNKKVMSGLRKKRVSWLDSPRVKTISRKKRPLETRLYSLNTEKRLSRYVKLLKEDQKEHPTRRPNETWLQKLADQGRMTPEIAAELTDFIFNESALKPENLRPRTYEALLQMWYSRKNLERATQVFEAMRTHNKLTDLGYSIYCKTLATRGQLDRAKELLKERLENTMLEGYEALRVMVNYVAAADIKEGVNLFVQWQAVRREAIGVLAKVRQVRREKKGSTVKDATTTEGETKPAKTPTAMPLAADIKRAKAILQYDDEMYSTIIGWCLRHGRTKQAEKYYKYRLALQQNRCPNYSDEQFSKMLAQHEKKLKERNAAEKEFEEQVKRLREDPDPTAYAKATRAGALKKPSINVPPYPVRYTKEEFIKQFPVVFTSHVLRPLVDLAAANEKIDPTWMKRIGDGLRNEDVRAGIIMVAQRIYFGDKKRYEAIQSLLKDMDLPYQELTRIPLPKVKHEAPVRNKKVPEVKKWWKVGGLLKQKED